MSRILGSETLLAQLERLGVSPEECMKKAMGKETKRVQATAKLLCGVNHGELRNSIKTKVETEEGKITGIVYTNKAYAPYVEFGTGPVGQANHAGISPEVTPAYSQGPWWIHESQIDTADAERYHFFKIETPDGVFYQTHGQPAQPFLYPALKANEENIQRGFNEDLRRQIARAIRGGR